MIREEFNVKEKQTNHRTDVDTYETLFMDGSTLSRNIFVLGQAGGGKTTLVKRLCNVWCFAKGNRSKQPQKLSDLAEDTLNRFDFLFLLLLRDVSWNECDIDEMIYSQIIRRLSRAIYYSEEFLGEVLHGQTCLVILDGLDEWSHPLKTKCEVITSIPHHRPRKKCTILSTTRPWKLFESGISNSMINKCIKLSELDASSAEILISNVLRIITDTQVNEQKETERLMNQVKSQNLFRLISNPGILIQLICVWHDKKCLGKTKCQIYSSIVDFLLERAEEKQGKISLQSYQRQAEVQDGTLMCLWAYEYSTKYIALLEKLGQLAFTALCSEKREFSLVFGSSAKKQLLSPEELHDCLLIGFLTENRTYSMSARQKSYSFMHETFQEYFCALYIAQVGDKCTSDFLKQCQSVSSTLKLSGVFVFLSGLCPELFNVVCDRLAEIISKDTVLVEFRRKVCTSIEWKAGYRMIKELQDMYMDCLKEAEHLNIIQKDLVIDGDCQNENYSEVLLKLINMNKGNIKSVKIYCEPNVTLSSYICNYALSELRHLDKVEVIVDKIVDSDLDLLLSGSASTLKCVSVCKDIGSQINPPCDLLSEGNVRTIQHMSSLTSIMLECLELDHTLLEDLFDCLEKRKEMTEICLGYIKCSVHIDECVGLTLDLSKHANLTMLEIGRVPLSDLKVNMKSLKSCRVGHFESQNILESVLGSLKEAKHLRSLMCFGIERPDEVEAILSTLPFLESLSVFVIKRVNIGDHIIDIKPDLEHLKLSSVKMTRSTFYSIAKKAEVRPRSIECEFLSCEFNSEEEYNEIKRYIEDSDKLVLLYNRKEENETYTITFTRK